MEFEEQEEATDQIELLHSQSLPRTGKREAWKGKKAAELEQLT